MNLVFVNGNKIALTKAKGSFSYFFKINKLRY